MNRTQVFVIVFILISLNPARVDGDILPPGHRNVDHKMVFEASPALENATLVAAPTAGFGGVCVINPGQRFDFSSKYGTRIYVLPDGVIVPKNFERELFQQWPSARPPRNQIRSVAVVSPISSALTTVRLKEISANGPVIQLVDHVEFDRFGKEVTLFRIMLFRGIPLLLGIAICVLLFRRMRATRKSNSISATDVAA